MTRARSSPQTTSIFYNSRIQYDQLGSSMKVISGSIFRSGLTGQIVVKLRMATNGHLLELPITSILVSQAVQVGPYLWAASCHGSGFELYAPCAPYPHIERRVPHYEGKDGCMVNFRNDSGAEVMSSWPVAVIICYKHRSSVIQNGFSEV